jgi:hypothetical protein
VTSVCGMHSERRTRRTTEQVIQKETKNGIGDRDEDVENIPTDEIMIELTDFHATERLDVANMVTSARGGNFADESLFLVGIRVAALSGVDATDFEYDRCRHHSIMNVVHLGGSRL